MNPSSPSYHFLHKYLCFSPRQSRSDHINAASHRKHRQLTTLTKLKMLLAKKKAIENEILTAMESMAEACEDFGEMLRSDDHTGLNMGET